MLQAQQPVFLSNVFCIAFANRAQHILNSKFFLLSGKLKHKNIKTVNFTAVWLKWPGNYIKYVENFFFRSEGVACW